MDRDAEIKVSGSLSQVPKLRFGNRVIYSLYEEHDLGVVLVYKRRLYVYTNL